MIPLPADPRVREAIFAKYFSQREDWEGELQEHLIERRRMSDYSGTPILELGALPLSLFLVIKRDAWIASMRATEAGREALKAIWRLQQTQPEIEKIRERSVSA